MDSIATGPADDDQDVEHTVFLCVRDLLCDKFELASQSVHLDSDLVGDLHIERADLDYLALALEEAFEIDISLDHAARLVRVSDAVDCVLASTR